ncbi:MAG: hypothetical protein HXS49_05630 [Theionarchaea archaeon]|nr:hypothetical protein [Theionarchaea archaeon]MBU6999709.1 hypothetical protein [Theionarchaea archaeon]MBU7034651.1 hypothetical protein [Theionarchaea archaeon]MBU7039860.1 hypothetical protein [Theionarchaea archaeon]
MINLSGLRDYLESFQDPEGKIRSENSVKATAEYALVYRLYPLIAVGNPERARAYLRNQLPPLAEYLIKKGFSSMEEIWQVAVGIPEDTLFLMTPVRELLHSPLSPSVKSGLLLLLCMQECGRDLSKTVQEIISYQEQLMKISSLDSLYETTHNLITFYFAQQYYPVRKIIQESCSWLAENALSSRECIDVVAEAAAVISLFEYEKDSKVSAMLDWVSKSQNPDGGFPVFASGKSEFHASLVSLWAFAGWDTSGCAQSLEP